MDQIIYHFGADGASGNIKMQNLLGGKGANLAEMVNLGLSVPPGFTISTELCRYYYDNSFQLPIDFSEQLRLAIKDLEKSSGKLFASTTNTLLVSVRSGAAISMPGMMDTILNLGINDEIVESLARDKKNAKFAYDSYRRFLEMYGSVVLGVPGYLFAECYDNYKQNYNILHDQNITTDILQLIVDDFKKLIERHTGDVLNEDPFYQLVESIKAVMNSWFSPRAIHYREINNITDIVGTAVNIQSMVFGNKNNSSATGVVFTRCPSTGEKKMFGEFLVDAQGEDVVAGIRTPKNINKNNQSSDSMEELFPKCFAGLSSIATKLEHHYKDMQDIEFTIEDEILYILQTRQGKRTAAASIKIAVDMVKEGLISKEEAILRVDPESLNQLLHTNIDYASNPTIIAQGLPASPGAATGIVAFSSHDAEQMSHHHKVILVRNDTSPEDIKGMNVAVGIVSARGGMTSHAAVVTRGMGKPCVCGVNNIVVDLAKQFFSTPSGIKIKQGDIITIDGSRGNILLGDITLIQPEFSKEFSQILAWSDEIRSLEVRSNAETPLDAEMAIKFGAEGIGLCRSEHMFFDEEKIMLVREMIVAVNQEQRQKAIDKLLPLQIKDFFELFKILNGKPINIRLLDPPLHEFLPKEEKDIILLAKNLALPTSVVEYKLHTLDELNPMLGHRGCRLGITHPEIYNMQIEAIITAMHESRQEDVEVILEVMIPLISDIRELNAVIARINDKIVELETKYHQEFKFKLGTMIELPRATIIADKLATKVDYFSFGTNDLTQTAYGISRDDIGSFLPDYLEKGIFTADPFVQIDEEGVGEMIKLAAQKGKEANNALTLGICGEHAGDPRSIDFFHKIGINYISCSPYRVPIARLSAAHSKIKFG